MDLSSYIFKTTNYGKSWKKIITGLDDPNGFARVVRADKQTEGLLYAGTETGVYISLDDGDKWQRLELNLPLVAINDLIIQDNDLVVATSGRGFWILDDLGALQNLNSSNEDLQIIKPKDTYHFFGGVSNAVGQGKNPQSGVTFDYYLAEEIDSLELKLEVLQNQKVIRSYTNSAPGDFKSWPGGPSSPKVLPSNKGYNRFTWDFRREALPAINKVFVFGGLSGSRVAPGNYTLKLTLGEQVSQTEVTILPNPAISANNQDFAEQQNLLTQIEGVLIEMHESVNQMRAVKTQLNRYSELLADRESAETLLEKGKELLDRINSWEENLIQADQKTFQDVINFNNMLNAQFIQLKSYMDQADPKVTQGAKQRLSDLMRDWKVYQNERDAIIDTEMKAFNSLFKSLEIPALIID
jgi:hypothetical protein